MKLLLTDNDGNVLDVFFDVEQLDLDDEDIQDVLIQWMKEGMTYINEDEESEDEEEENSIVGEEDIDGAE